MKSRTQAILVCTFPLGLTSHNRLFLGYFCLRRRRRLLDMAEVDRRCLLDMAIFLKWSLSSAICRHETEKNETCLKSLLSSRKTKVIAQRIRATQLVFSAQMPQL